MKQHKLWHTYFFEDLNPNHKKIEKKLKKYIYAFDKKTEQSELGRGLKRNLSEPPFDFLDSALVDCEAFQQLFSWINSRMRSFVKRINKKCIPPAVKWKIHHDESWYHITKNGGFHGPHLHSNISWGWIYYFNNIDIKKDGGSNKFYNPLAQQAAYIDVGLLYMTSYHWSMFEVAPKAGKLIVYPGWLLHDAQPYFGNKDRIILSGNTQVLAEQ